MSLKKEDRAFLDETVRGHVSKAKIAYEDAVEAACLHGDDEDLDRMEKASKRYVMLLKAQTLLTDLCA